MGEKDQKKSNKKNSKRKIKCYQCEFYSYDDDYCTEREIENCTRQNNINFAKCDNYLVRSNLVMF